MNRHLIRRLIKTFHSSFHTGLLTIAILGSISACSVYESSGRKSLESNGYSLAGVHLASCVNQSQPASDLPVFETESAQVFKSDVSEDALIVNLKQPALFSCNFHSDVVPAGSDQFEATVQLTLEKSRTSN